MTIHRTQQERAFLEMLGACNECRKYFRKAELYPVTIDDVPVHLCEYCYERLKDAQP